MLSDNVVVDKNYRLSISHPMDITDPVMNDRFIDSAMGISPGSIRKLLAPFQLNDTERAQLGLDEPTLHGVYSSVRKKPNSAEYIRDQVMVTIFLADNKMVRLYVRAERDNNFEQNLQALESKRNVLALFDLLKLDNLDEDLGNRVVRAPRPSSSGPYKGNGGKPSGPYKGKGPSNGGKDRSNGERHENRGPATSRPFAQLNNLGGDFPSRNQRPRKEKGDRRRERDDFAED